MIDDLGKLTVIAIKMFLPQVADLLLGVIGAAYNPRGERLARAIRTAHQRSWDVLRIILSGRTWWNRLVRPDSDDLAAAVEQILTELAPAGIETMLGEGRRECLIELDNACRAGLLSWEPSSGISSKDLALTINVGRLGRHAEDTVNSLALRLAEHEFERLASLVRLKLPPQNQPLLVVVVGFFLRRAVEDDEVLARGVAHLQLTAISEHVAGLSESQQKAFEQFSRIYGDHARELAELLAPVPAMLDRISEGVDHLGKGIDDLGKRLAELEQAHRTVFYPPNEQRRSPAPQCAFEFASPVPPRAGNAGSIAAPPNRPLLSPDLRWASPMPPDTVPRVASASGGAKMPASPPPLLSESLRGPNIPARSPEQSRQEPLPGPSRQTRSLLSQDFLGGTLVAQGAEMPPASIPRTSPTAQSRPLLSEAFAIPVR